MSDNDTFSAWNEEVKALAVRLNASHDFQINTKFLMGVLFPVQFSITINFKDGASISQSGSRFRTTLNNLQRNISSERLRNGIITEKKESVEEQMQYPESYHEEISLKDIAENVYPKHKDFIKKVVTLYEDFNHHCMIDFCQICDEPLTQEEKTSITKEMMNITCDKHKEYAGHHNLHEARKRAGYKGQSSVPLIKDEDFSEFVKATITSYRFDKRKMNPHHQNDFCGICYKKLTQQELQAQAPMDWFRACEIHHPYAQNPQMEIIKKELGLPLHIPLDF